MSSGINLMDLLDQKGPSELNEDRESSYQEVEQEQEEGRRFSLGTGLDGREQFRVLLTLILGAATYFGPLYYEEHLMKGLQVKQQELQRIQTKIREEEDKKRVLASIREEMVEFDRRMDELRRKIAKVNNLNDNRNLLVRSIDFLVTEMPQDIWLTRVEAKRGASGTIQVDGYAKDLQNVSNFMKKLESAVFFPTWGLEETSHEDKGKVEASANSSEIPIPRDVKKFSIRAKLEEPVEP